VATSTMPASNGREPSMPIDQEIILDYDPKTYAVMVNTSQVNTGDTICFRGARGEVRVVFISPFGDDTIEMADSEPRTLTVGGHYHYQCYFTPYGGKEIQGKTGGILDVQPHRP
jgi:plastocyanin